MKNIIIITPQEYRIANHLPLWIEMAKKKVGKVIVVNISADYFITILKGKKYRLDEAKQGGKQIRENLTLVRPLYPIRPELFSPLFTPKRIISKLFWKTIRKVSPSVMKEEVDLVIYDARWCQILQGTHSNMRIGYYLIDEVRREAHNDKINKTRYLFDEYACKNCDFVMTMTGMLAESRRQYNKNTFVIGNGASPLMVNDGSLHIQKSVAFIGNFRDWIDFQLLEDLVKKRTDLLFSFVGNIEESVRNEFNVLLNNNLNTNYWGKCAKKDIRLLYSYFDVIIVPYKQNHFIKNTRPIKIVEAVMSGRPVVTVPNNGYEQTSFIRFATDVESFSSEIDYCMENPVDVTSNEYQKFVLDNSWSNKADVIISTFKNLRSVE